MHYQSSLSLLDAADCARILCFIHPFQHKVVLLIHWQFVSFALASEALTLHSHVQIILDWPELVAILRTRHLSLMEIHSDALRIVPVNIRPVHIVLEARVLRLITWLSFIPAIDGSQDSRTRETSSSIINLVIIAT